MVMVMTDGDDDDYLRAEITMDGNDFNDGDYDDGDDDDDNLWDNNGDDDASRPIWRPVCWISPLDFLSSFVLYFLSPTPVLTLHSASVTKNGAIFWAKDWDEYDVKHQTTQPL